MVSENTTSQEFENVNALTFFKGLLNGENNNELVLEKNDKKEVLQTEAEVKVFPGYEIKNGLFKEKENVEKENEKLEQEIQSKGKKIFEGTIEDIRYDNKYLKDNGINIIRVRHLHGKELNEKTGEMEQIDKYLLTVKSRGANKFEVTEYEEEYTKLELDNIMRDNCLTPTRRYKKQRTEYKSNISLLKRKKRILKKIGNEYYGNKNYKELKFAFDKYLDYIEDEKEKISENEGKDVIENYGIIPKFVEIESKDGIKTVREATEILGLKNNAITLKGVRKLKEFFNLKETLDTVKSLKTFVSSILNNRIFINDEFVDKDKTFTTMNKEDNKKVTSKTKGISLFYTKSIKESLKNLINENEKYKDLFRDFFEENKNEGNNEENNINNLDFSEKFYKKINRYLPGFEIAISNSVSTILEKKLENSEEINDDVLRDILKEQLNKFLNLLFIYGNNLNRKQLEELLDLKASDNKINFNSLKSNIDDLSKNENPKSLLVARIIRKISAELYFDNKKIDRKNDEIYKRNSKKSNNEKYLEKKKLSEKLEEHIIDNFGMLAKSFNLWLISPKENEDLISQTILDLKERFKDLFEIILILKEEDIAFDDSKYAGINENNVIGKILKIEEFKNTIFDSDNFSLCDIEGGEKLEKEKLEKFLLGIKISNSDDKENNSDGNNIIKEIKEEFLKFNENNIINILTKKVKYGDNEITIQEFEEKVNINNFDVDKISYDLWKTAPYHLRFKIYVNNILKNEDKNKEIYSKITEYNESNEDKNLDEYKKVNSFIKIEYSKKYHIKDYSRINIESARFKKYKTKILEQIKNAYSLFTNQDLEENNFIDLFETNKNDSDLLVAWLRFRFKYNQVEKQNAGKEEKDKIKIKDLHINSDNFIEQIIYNLGKKNSEGNKKLEINENGKLVNNIGAEIIIGTSDAHNTSAWNASYMDNKHKHALEKGLIQIDKSFYLQNSDDTKTFFKDIEALYLPNKEEGKELSPIEIKKYIQKGLDLCTRKLDGQFINKEDIYYKQLENINFPFENITLISKLKEFLKYSKDILEVSEDMQKKAIGDKDFFSKFDDDFKSDLDLGEDELIIGDIKSIDRIFAKNIGKYAGHLSKIGDINRMTIVKDSFEDLSTTASDFIKKVGNMSEVKQVWVEDNIGNLFEKAKQNSGYRDSKITLVLKNGNTVEVQFQLKEYLEIKKNGLKLDDTLIGNIKKELNFFKKEKLEESKQKGYFSTKEKLEILNKIRSKNLKFPENFYTEILGIKEKEKYKNFIKKDEILIDDYLYNISRISVEGSLIKEKIQTIQNVLYDVAGGKESRGEAERIIGEEKVKK